MASQSLLPIQIIPSPPPRQMVMDIKLDFCKDYLRSLQGTRLYSMLHLQATKEFETPGGLFRRNPPSRRAKKQTLLMELLGRVADLAQKKNELGLGGWSQTCAYVPLYGMVTTAKRHHMLYCSQ